MKKLVIIAVVFGLFMATGCAKKKTEPAPLKPVVIADQEVDRVLTPMQRYQQDYAKLPTSHVVVKGECLWWIAEYQQIYNDPFMWPLIYKANKSQINDPDLIFPGQTFAIPRAFTLDEAKENRKMAGAPWQMLAPGADAVIPAEMRSALGYGF